jgi:uncharacterized protein (DUF2164 family)
MARRPQKKKRTVYDAIEMVQEKVMKQGLDSLSSWETTVYDLDALYWEFANGGLGQYFYNSAGDRFAEVLRAGRTIGAHELVEALEALGLKFCCSGPSPNGELRLKQLKKVDEADLRGTEQRMRELEMDVYRLLQSHCDANWVDE